ncbi:TPA: hypothetical protein I2U44_12180 [Staphylococcus aureus]|nr:hypothetical protein AB888_03180 [Staphylococcus aureus]QFK79333.1 hypothetical protein DQV67_01715 [Staphylococcus aureus]HAR7388459.1 hypothetical protein [Staphylococcus aureus]
MAGPQHKEFRKEILQVMQVGGAPTQRNSKRNSTGNASWGRTGINFAKISFLFQSRDVKIFKKIMPLTKYSVNV